MTKYIAVLLLSVVLFSCKAKMATIGEADATTSLSASKIIKNHYKNKRDYKSMYIKASARYQDSKQTQNVTAEIRIKKDEAILVSIRFLGITMAKALITPKEVKYYEKLNSEFFEGDFTTLSKWLGTDLDYYKVQNLLTGEALDNLNEGTFKASIEDKLYKLNGSSSNVDKTYYFEAENFLIKKQQIIQTDKDRYLEITYPSHAQYNTIILPTALLIEAQQEKSKNNINISYNSVTFDEDFSIPYSVPEGYKQIFIN